MKAILSYREFPAWAGYVLIIPEQSDKRALGAITEFGAKDIEVNVEVKL
jgi:hypothetical protein